MNYAVVIVNWNGAVDTIACIDSIISGKNSGRLIVIDNGSFDESLSRIGDALRAHGITPRLLDAEELPGPSETARAFLLAAGENLGFAIGCNRGLRVAAALECEVVLFLNNDTVVEADALDCIVQRLLADSAYFACLPMLTEQDGNQIWNCGGTVSRLGLRRYYLAGRLRIEGERLGEIRCSFFTGCCFAVRTVDFLARDGFSERFFFGEEDFELALWMKERALMAVCLTSAVVRHKVSVAFNFAAGKFPSSDASRAKVFVYYLNRFIHMRLRLGTFRWWLWMTAYFPYVMWLLWRNEILSINALPRFAHQLIFRARMMDGVAREDFEAVMGGNYD